MKINLPLLNAHANFNFIVIGAFVVLAFPVRAQAVSLDELGAPTRAADVLGAADYEQFVIDEGTVFYHFRGLRWQRCSLGMTWAEGKCFGQARKVTHRELISMMGVRWSGRKWRVPTKEEIRTINNVYKPGFKADASVFPDLNEGNQLFWTADTSRRGAPWVANVKTGSLQDDFDDFRSNSHRLSVRFVRAEPKIILP